MPTIEKLTIDLGQDPSIPFSPGQTISGVVRLNLRSELKLRNLKLDFEGRGKNEWKEYQYYAGNDYRSIYYTAKETYLEGTNMMYPPDGENPKETHRLPAGNHEFPFQLTLPTDAPPTFEGNDSATGVKAKIEYSITVQVDRPWRIDTKNKVWLLVRGGADLNTLPNMQTPMQKSQAKQLTSMFGKKKGVIEAIVTVARPAFVIGEDIGLQVLVKNQSNSEIKTIWAELFARVAVSATETEWTNDEKTKVHTEKLAVAESNQVIPPAGEEVVRLENFVIPPKVSPTFRTGIINVNHFIKVTVDPGGMHSYLEVENIPIIIGAIPLRLGGEPNGIVTRKLFGKK